MALSAAPGVLVPFVVSAREPGPDSLPVVQTSEARVIGDIREWRSFLKQEDALGSTDQGQITTACYPFADIDFVIVRQYSKGFSSLKSFLGAPVIGFVSGYLALWLALRH